MTEEEKMAESSENTEMKKMSQWHMQ